jgi:hypothetical protein
MAMEREPALREICERHPRLLRVERVPARGRRSAQHAHALILLFDRLQLCVRADPEAEALEVSASGAPLVEDALRADEDEPWWMLLGAPLVAAWQPSDPERAGATLELQFREDGSNPKVVVLRFADGHIIVRAQPKDDWLAGRETEKSSGTETD